MQIRLKSLKLTITTAGLVAILFGLAYLYWKPLTYNKIKMKTSCHRINETPSTKLPLHIDFNMERPDCQMIVPIIKQIFAIEVASRQLRLDNNGIIMRVKEWFKEVPEHEEDERQQWESAWGDVNNKVVDPNLVK